MRVVRTSPAFSAGAFSNLIVMLGCWAWNSSANFFIVGWLPTHEKKVTVVGDVGSFTGPGPWPIVSLAGSLGPLPLSSLLPHAARLTDVASARVTTAGTFQDLLTLIAPLLLDSSSALRRRPPQTRCTSYANRLASWREASSATPRVVNGSAWPSSQL